MNYYETTAIVSFPYFLEMLAYSNKRKPLSDMSNTDVTEDVRIEKRFTHISPYFMPLIPYTKANDEDVQEKQIYVQNVHPLLDMYQNDIVTSHTGYAKFSDLVSMDNEMKLLDFLADMGIIAKYHQCEFCGGQMRKSKQGNIWYWICTRRVNGQKCNKGKFGVRKGTFLDRSHLSIQTVMRIIYNFVCRLSETQCKNFVAIGTKTNHTVGEYYADCRQVCTNWIWDVKNTPKLGGFGKIVEMDESYFPGAPKYNRGRRLGTTWEDNDKWVFGMVERGSLDCILQQVPPNRTRKMLLPIINAHCENGTIFNSDGWRAYGKLAENLDLQDCLHYPVNHSANYVDPDTGAYTQTIEGLWSHVKDFLPSRGMKPHDLQTYLGWFMWDRFTRQRNLDPFIHFLNCAANVRPPSYKQEYQLPPATMTRIGSIETVDDDIFA